MLDWLMARAKERSTWRGIAILAGLGGFAIDPMQVEMIGMGVVGAIGAVEALTADKAVQG